LKEDLTITFLLKIDNYHDSSLSLKKIITLSISFPLERNTCYHLSLEGRKLLLFIPLPEKGEVR
jgi:hypothetical protein